MKRTALMAALAAMLAATAQAAVTEFIIYKQPNFRGASHTVKGEVASLEGGFARKASSLVVKGGRSVRVERSAENLRDSRFDGRASSIVVNEGTWQLCSEPRFEGICRVYEPGQYAHLAELDDRVSSLRRVR